MVAAIYDSRRGGHVLLRVLACGVCRTDLHIVKTDLPPLKAHLILGHQIEASSSRQTSGLYGLGI